MTGWGSVIAIEAQERIYYALAGNIALNNCFNASALHAAVGAEAGELRIPVPDYTAAGSFGSLELRQRPSTEYIGQAVSYDEGDLSPVPMITVDGLGLPRLDLIKIDIEGMEEEALKGAEATIEACRPVLIIEFIKSDREKLAENVRKRGYQVFRKGINFVCVH